jgi:hypothetical protein
MPAGTDQENIVDRMLEDFLMKVSFNSQITKYSFRLRKSFLLTVKLKTSLKIRFSRYNFIRMLDIKPGPKVQTTVLI